MVLFFSTSFKKILIIFYSSYISLSSSLSLYLSLPPQANPQNLSSPIKTHHKPTNHTTIDHEHITKPLQLEPIPTATSRPTTPTTHHHCNPWYDPSPQADQQSTKSTAIHSPINNPLPPQQSTTQSNPTTVTKTHHNNPINKPPIQPLPQLKQHNPTIHIKNEERERERGKGRTHPHRHQPTTMNPHWPTTTNPNNDLKEPKGKSKEKKGFGSVKREKREVLERKREKERKKKKERRPKRKRKKERTNCVFNEKRERQRINKYFWIPLLLQ